MQIVIRMSARGSQGDEPRGARIPPEIMGGTLRWRARVGSTSGHRSGEAVMARKMKASPSRPRRAARPETEAAAVHQCPEVGLGASAGGRDAFRQESAGRQGADSEQRKAHFTAIVDNAVDAILTVDDQGIIDFFNPAAAAMFRFDPDKILGSNIRTLIAGLELSEYDGARREFTGKSRDGATFPIDLMISEIRCNERRAFAIIARNVSEQRKLQKDVLEAGASEQRRISRDLHDRVGQELTGIGYLAASLCDQLGATPQGELAAKITRSIERAIGEVHNAIRGLTPVAMDDDGLAAALEGLALRTQERFGIPCQFVGDWSIRLGDNRVATHLYFIAQEAVHNAVKHARASQVTVRLSQHSDQLTLQVSDDGVGIPRRRPAKQGMGLGIMRYRAAEIGAAMAIERGDGRGTRVTCTLPGSKHHG
jgi:PAS domain S-box-containing protein